MRTIPKLNAGDVAELEAVLARLQPGDMRPRLVRLNWVDQRTGARYELDRDHDAFKVFLIG